MTAENAYGRSRTLRRRHLQMIALGGAASADRRDFSELTRPLERRH
jgi:hypothetical protein